MTRPPRALSSGGSGAGVAARLANTKANRRPKSRQRRIALLAATQGSIGAGGERFEPRAPDPPRGYFTMQSLFFASPAAGRGESRRNDYAGAGLSASLPARSPFTAASASRITRSSTAR